MKGDEERRRFAPVLIDSELGVPWEGAGRSTRSQWSVSIKPLRRQEEGSQERPGRYRARPGLQ